jgi:lysophospholipase L1-like esterase
VRVQGRSREQGMYGPAGIAFDVDRPARTAIDLAPGVAACDSIALHFMRQPRGGTIEITLEPSGARRTLSTAGARLRAEVITLRAPNAIRRAIVSARGDGPVRVFGASFERDRSGVVIDALGIPGARMRDRLPWDDAGLRAQLDALAPDLIALAYGTNESGSGDRSIDADRREIEEAVRRARAAAPNASCLLIGPSDWPARTPEGGFIPRARTAQIVRVQREVAARHGCGFFDLVAFTGGPGSMTRWAAAGLALEDHVHFSDEGYRLLGRALSRALLRGASFERPINRR